jgi:hypothetical protein
MVVVQLVSWPMTMFSRKAFTWTCAPFDQILLYRTFATIQSIGNATETLTPVAETIYHTQHVLLPYFFFWKARYGIHMVWLMCWLVFMGYSRYPINKSDFYVASYLKRYLIQIPTTADNIEMLSFRFSSCIISYTFINANR